MDTYKVAVIGATGYTGSELLRFLIHHPNVQVAAVTSNSRAGMHITEVHPQLTGLLDMELTRMDELDPRQLDLVFLALPHGVSMDFVRDYGYRDFKIVDLSGDFRLNSVETYEQWYGATHSCPQAYSDAVYGMPELFRRDISQARLVANPGCYPTSGIVPLAPLVREHLIRTQGIVVDAKSGVTGAGTKLRDNTHFPNANENFSVYGVKTHRHTPEIQDLVNRFAGQAINVQFTPHLLPINRGILSTVYAEPHDAVSDQELFEVYQRHYGAEPFVRVFRHPPALQQVRGTNFCDLYATYDERTGRVLIVTCIDNLVKGASGVAVQNMNLMLGLPEEAGLAQVPMMP